MGEENFYRTFEHTADLGIEVWGKDLKTTFTNAAKALFSEIIHGALPKPQKGPIKIEVSGTDIEDLFVRWLEELLFLSETKKLIFTEFKIITIEQKKLTAKVWGVDLAHAQPKTEIKAITYHALEFKKTDNGYVVKFVADV